MGGNNSKLNPNGGEVLPAGVRPLLRQRIEEFKKRRNGATLRGEEGTLSRKQLLKDDGGNPHPLSDDNEIEETQPPKEKTVVRAVLVEKLSKVVPLPVSESGAEEQRNEPHKDHHQEKEKDVEKKAEIKSAGPQPQNKHEQVNAKHGDNGDDGDDEEEEEEEDGEYGRLIGPGSPSFRIYCIEAEEREEEELLQDIDAHAGEKEKQTIAMHQKSPSTDSDDSAASASENSGNSNEVGKIEKLASKRKGHKIKKLGAMKKNLLHIKNLPMNRMVACTGNDRRTLLSDN